MRAVILFVRALVKKFCKFCFSFPNTTFPQSLVIFSMQFGVHVHGVITEMPIKHLELVQLHLLGHECNQYFTSTEKATQDSTL